MERVYLDHGVAVQRRGRTWAVDVYRRGRRVVMSLGTTDKSEAMIKGWGVVHALQKPDSDIESDAWVIQCALKGIDTFFLCEGGDPRNEMPQEQVAALSLDRLRRRAFEGVDMKSIVRETMCEFLPATKPAPSPVDIEESIKDYLPVRRSKSRAKDGSYIKNVESQIKKFATWANVAEISRVTPDMISRYLVHTREEQQLSDKSAKDRYDILRQWLDWEVGRGNLDKNPASGLEPAKPKRKPIVYFKAPEVGRILDGVRQDAEVSALVHAATFAGLRKGELFRLKWTEVDLVGRSITVTDTKTGEPRIVPILDQLLPALNALPKDKERVFERWADEHAFGRIVQRAVQRAISRDEGLQAMRRTFVTNILLTGVSPHVAAKWAGHDVAVQQKRYAGIVSMGEEPVEMTWHGRQLVPHGLPNSKSTHRERRK
jgi:integrase